MPSQRPATWWQRLLSGGGAPVARGPSRGECLASPVHLDGLIEASRPASRPPTVCLCMIVKNEAAVIERCLASARPLITHWIVVDTGSTDGTQERVRRALADLPGECVERPWVDFAHNRSEALALARPLADYSLVIDADDEFVVPAGYVLPALADDSYTVDIHYAGSTYQRPQLVRNALPWRYRGVLHEFLECEGAASQGHLPVVMRINHEGARSTDPQTYARDAAILERALEGEADPFLVARYTFYLAQSFRDSGQPAKAAEAYLRRAEMGFWIEEVFVSLYQAGQMMEASGADDEAVLATYARATAAVPGRAEAAHAGARLCRNRQRFARGFELAASVLGLPAPGGGLFVETWVYGYGVADEYAVNASWCGRYRECLDGCLRALQSGVLPAHEQARILANMRVALDNLPAAAPPAQTVSTQAAPAAPEAAAEPPPQLPPAEAPPVEAGSARALPTVLHLGSGKDFRDDWLNVDIDPSWHPDALVDLAAVDLAAVGVASMEGGAVDVGTSVETARFGTVRLGPGAFERIVANDVLEHVADLVALMTNCLALLRTGGTFEIAVPYDLGYGAWQDPTHVRTFNERSWLYYTDWFWYLGWREARFALDAMEHVLSPLGAELVAAGRPAAEVHRTPRAVDAMRVTLRKVALDAADREALAHWRDRRQAAARRPAALPAAGHDEASRAGGGRDPFPALWAEARDRHCIHLHLPPDDPHAEGLRDAAQDLADAFAALGGSAPLVTDASHWDGRVPIVFGAHLLPRHPLRGLPPEAILFNLEQVDAASPWMGEDYRSLLRRHRVLDYSLRNIRALAAAGLGHARHLAIRAMPRPARPEAARPTDVLFVGSMNPRRAAVLDALRARGASVVELFGVYGRERDAAVAGAKLVLNVHFYEAAIFEAVRVCPLMAAGACVVSEGDAADPDVADIAAGLVLGPVAELPGRVEALLADADGRAALSRRAREAIALRSQAEVLRAAFPDAPAAHPPAAA